MVFIHAYETPDRIPSELEANSKILDEAFPAITIDLIFLKGTFSPEVSALALADLLVANPVSFLSLPRRSASSWTFH